MTWWSVRTRGRMRGEKELKKNEKIVFSEFSISRPPLGMLIHCHAAMQPSGFSLLLPFHSVTCPSALSSSHLGIPSPSFACSCRLCRPSILRSITGHSRDFINGKFEMQARRETTVVARGSVPFAVSIFLCELLQLGRGLRASVLFWH